ncbi:MAG TPA: DUF1579 domain-containing protein [Planctomycetaceae bacterium]|nr:DUF1579 domain-containing protein [Planctomycetaceae bacterium]
MKSLSYTFSALVTLLTVTNASAQELPEFPKPTKEHLWLKQFEGEWVSKSKASMGPGVPEIECQGKMTSRTLGGFWIVNQIEGDMMGMTMHGLQTIGYDTDKKKYVGTWVDSMMNYMWKYEGTVEESGKKLTLEAEGPNFMAEGKMTKFRDAYEFKSKDEIIATSSMRMEDGKWVTFMTGTIKRK